MGRTPTPAPLAPQPGSPGGPGIVAPPSRPAAPADLDVNAARDPAWEGIPDPAGTKYTDTPVAPLVPASASSGPVPGGQVVRVQQTPQGPVAVDQSGAPLFNIADEYRRAKMMVASGVPAFVTAGTQNMRLLETMMTRGEQFTTSGGVMPIPGSAETAARAAGLKTGAEREAALPYEVAAKRAEAAVQAGYRMKEIQPVPGGPTYYVSEADLAGRSLPPGASTINPGAGSPPGQTFTNGLGPAAKQPGFIEKGQEAVAKDMEDMGKQFQARQIVRERLGELRDIVQSYQTGHWAEQKAQFIARARALGLPVPNFDTANPAAFEQFIKNQTANIFDQVKAIGGRVLVSEIQGLSKANANPEMQPEANRAIIGQAIGLLNYEDKYFNDFTTWHRANQYATQDDRTAFDSQWVKDNPLRPFTQAAQRETPVKGEVIPEPSKREKDRLYMTSKGPAYWRVGPGPASTGWELQSQ